MTGNDLFREIGGISEKYIAEAEATKRSIIHNTVFRRSLATAACLMVCVGLYFTTRTGSKEAATDSTGAAGHHNNNIKEDSSDNTVMNYVTGDTSGGFELDDILDFFGDNDRSENTTEAPAYEADSAYSENCSPSEPEYSEEGVAVGEAFDYSNLVKRLLSYPNEYEALLQTDAFIVEHGIVRSGMERWDAFIDCVERGVPALVEVVQFTDEGDAIVAGILYNGKVYYLLMDYSRDAWGNTDWLEYVYNNLYLDTRDGRTKVLLSVKNVEKDKISEAFDKSPEDFFEWVEYVND